MLLKHVVNVLLNPKSGWAAVSRDHKSVVDCYLQFIVFLALIPPVAAFYGTTQIGWQLGWHGPVKLTIASALAIAVAYYVAILVTIFIVGKGIHWMANTYGASPSLADCVKLAAFIATPLLLVGAVQGYPVLWFNFLVALPALGYTVYLLYTGVPVIMGICEERGFLFSSAVLTFGLVALVSLLGLTVMMWSVGLTPELRY